MASQRKNPFAQMAAQVGIARAQQGLQEEIEAPTAQVPEKEVEQSEGDVDEEAEEAPVTEKSRRCAYCRLTFSDVSKRDRHQRESCKNLPAGVQATMKEDWAESQKIKELRRLAPPAWKVPAKKTATTAPGPNDKPKVSAQKPAPASDAPPTKKARAQTASTAEERDQALPAPILPVAEAREEQQPARLTAGSSKTASTVGPTITPDALMAASAIKVKIGKDFIRFPVKNLRSVSLDALYRLIGERCGPNGQDGPFQLRYRDLEGDWVRLEEDDEWAIARHEGTTHFEVKVVKGGAVEERPKVEGEFDCMECGMKNDDLQNLGRHIHSSHRDSKLKWMTEEVRQSGLEYHRDQMAKSSAKKGPSA